MNSRTTPLQSGSTAIGGKSRGRLLSARPRSEALPGPAPVPLAGQKLGVNDATDDERRHLSMP